MKFLVIEGIDGSGKSTQIELIKEYLNNNKILFQYLHFPRTESPVFGELIAKFLRGEFGQINEINPYLVALIYAGDRENAKHQINLWLKECMLLVDRYVYSNMAFQCAKIDDRYEKNKLREWIRYMEYEYFKIPKPDLNLYLNVPFEFTRNKLSKNRQGTDRNYLNGKTDIHEASLNFQEKVKNEYLYLATVEDNYKIIDCSDNEGNILPPYLILEKIIYQCKSHKIF